MSREPAAKSSSDSRQLPWSLRSALPRIVEQFREELGLSRVLAQVLVARGIQEGEVARRYLDPRLGYLLPPTGMAGMEQAVARLGAAVRAGESIGIFGDYDVDGISSVVLIADYLRQLGAPIIVRIARRDEGYGFGVAQAEALTNQGCSLLVLADCGTSDHAAVAAAQRVGVDVIAVDHHQLTSSAWPGLALVNPQRADCAYPFKGLCSAGLSFYLVASLRRHLEEGGRSAPDPRESLDLVSLGTIADVAPLESENRILVARGLAQLGLTKRPGLRELMRLSNIGNGTPSSEDVGWRLGPRLNAPGRLGDASVAFDCLWETDPEKAVLSARRCDAANEQRKAIQAKVEAEALAMAQEQADRDLAFLMVGGEGWHPGVIGIVASKLVTQFRRPAAVLALSPEGIKGSARSVPGIDLVQLLKPCAAHLLRYGGHAAAAGFAVAPDAVDALHQMLHAQAASQASTVDCKPLAIDVIVSLGALDLALCKELQRLGPHGCSNPEPVFAARAVTVQSVRTVGRDHISLVLGDRDGVQPAIGFGMLAQQPAVGAQLDVAFALEVDDYQGPRVRLRLIDLRRAGEGLQPASE